MARPLRIERGYICRNEKGHLHLTETVGDDFEAMTDEVVQTVLATAARLQALLAHRQPPRGAPKGAERA